MNILFDIRYALRNLAKAGSFSALTIAVMTIGLASSIYVLTIVKSLLFEPIYFPEGERVINIQRRVNNEWRSTLLHDYQKIREESKTLELTSAFDTETAVLADEFKSVRYSGVHVKGDYFAITGIDVALGRTLTKEDYIPGSLPVVILSHEIWQNHFGGDKDIIGRSIKINRKSTQVIGVTVAGVEHPAPNMLWQPLQQDANNIPFKKSPSIHFYARVKPGVAIDQAIKEIESIFSNSPELAPIPGQVITPRILPLKISYISGGITTFYIMLSAALFVLLLCCINVANLLLARANGRMKETAIRLALGAPRKKLISQMMWEAFIICSAGGLLAILLAGWGLDTTMAFFASNSNSGHFPKWAQMSLQADNILVAMLVIASTIVLTGFIPAIRASNCAFNEILKDGSKTSLGKKSGWVSKALVGLQISLSCTLMIVSGVQFIIIHQAINKGYGVSLENFISGRVNPHRDFYSKGEAQTAYFDRLLAEAQRIPGVEAATLISAVPMEWSTHRSIEPEGQGYDGNDLVRSNIVTAYPDALQTLGIGLLEGRLFDERDTSDSPEVVVVSDLLARMLWPNESAIGKRLRTYSDKKEKPKKWITVIGVVPQVVQNEMFDAEKTPNMYRPFAQNPRDAMAVVLKTLGDPALYKDDLEHAALKIDPNTPLYRANPFTVQAKQDRTFEEFVRTIFGLFALSALVMAATGIYGMMTNHVKRRTQEIGIKRALGIPDRAITRLMMHQSTLQLAAGTVIGVPLGYVLSQLFVQDLGAVTDLYQMMYFLVPAIIAAVVFTATMIPLLKVLQQSPASALRYE
ncbi:duplicated orphan permease [Alteromonadaceae bacterium Bs31]|nr:duplicated orphan permease [Alteromonadaceae bacterium Bs31]